MHCFNLFHSRNAISALFSIARKDSASYTAIAAGDETIEAAFTEAIGLFFRRSLLSRIQPKKKVQMPW
jgi:hypothetical protein